PRHEGKREKGDRCGGGQDGGTSAKGAGTDGGIAVILFGMKMLFEDVDRFSQSLSIGGGNLLADYFHKVRELITLIEKEEGERLRQAACRVAESLRRGGIVQLFGCGHSHLLTEEVFYRAGGLVPVKPILIEPLMLHE